MINIVSRTKAENWNTDLFGKTEWCCNHSISKCHDAKFGHKWFLICGLRKEKCLAYTLKAVVYMIRLGPFKAAGNIVWSFVLLLKRIKGLLYCYVKAHSQWLFKSPLQQLSTAESLTLYSRQCQEREIQEKRKKRGLLHWMTDECV